MGELSWKAHPLKDGAPRSYLVVLALAGICLLMKVAFGGWLWSALAGLFLLGSLRSWLFPTAYRLTPEGVEVRFLGLSTLKPWSRFRNLYPHRMGLHLSPFEKPSGLDPFRGIFLRYTPGRGSEILAFCRERIP